MKWKGIGGTFIDIVKRIIKIGVDDAGWIDCNSVRIYPLTTAITANSTVTTAPVGSIAFTSHATGRGNFFRSDGSKWQWMDSALAGLDALRYKGAIDCSANPNYPAADAGDVYKVSAAGKIGGAAGVNVEAGDMLICAVDGTLTGTQAQRGANWNVIQTSTGEKELYGLLTQTGTDAPTIGELKNTLGAVVIGRSEAGSYTLTKVGAFTEDKTFGFRTSLFNQSDVIVYVRGQRVTDDVFEITASNAGGNLTEIEVEDLPIRIVVFP